MPVQLHSLAVSPSRHVQLALWPTCSEAVRALSMYVISCWTLAACRTSWDGTASSASLTPPSAPPPAAAAAAAAAEATLCVAVALASGAGAAGAGGAAAAAPPVELGASEASGRLAALLLRCFFFSCSPARCKSAILWMLVQCC